MKQVFFFVAVFTITTVLSCASKSDEVKADTAPAVSTPATVNTLPQANTPTVNPLPQTVTTPVVSTPVVTPAKSAPVSIPATVQPAAANTAGLNPAHGQPGHRCEIAVGAPLNSSPVTTNTPTIAQKPVTVTTPQIVTTPTQTAAVAPGMNPAHGQPGHRCDISVGAPLNSAPAAQPTITTLPAQKKN